MCYCPPRNDGYEYFALNVRGDSMKLAGILNGDIVIAQKTTLARDGEIIVAMIDDEATVKNLLPRQGLYPPTAENPDYQPIYATEVSCTRPGCSRCAILSSFPGLFEEPNKIV